MIQAIQCVRVIKIIVHTKTSKTGEYYDLVYCRTRKGKIQSRIRACAKPERNGRDEDDMGTTSQGGAD